MKAVIVIVLAMSLDVYFYWHALEMKYTPTKWWFKWLPISGLILFFWNYHLCTQSDGRVES